MQLVEHTIPAKEAYLIPIGDIHVGDKSFGSRGMKLLLGYLDWVKKEPNARIFLMGDVFNCASRISKTSPFETDKNEYTRAAEFFAPYKDKIIGAIDGNHEARVLDMFGMSPTQQFCRELGIAYCEWSCILRLNVGRHGKEGAKGERVANTYHIYLHHTTGGGTTVGGKLNRVQKLTDIVEGVDVCCGGHNHQLACAPIEKNYPSLTGHDVQRKRIWLVDCGSYLEWNGSYAERGQMAPTKLGSPKIWFSGNHHDRDVHVSI